MRLTSTIEPSDLDVTQCRNRVTSPWLHPLVILALNTSARQGELLDLKREADLDLERNLIYFGRTKNRKLKVVPMNSPLGKRWRGF